MCIYENLLCIYIYKDTTNFELEVYIGAHF